MFFLQLFEIFIMFLDFVLCDSFQKQDLLIQSLDFFILVLDLLLKLSLFSLQMLPDESLILQGVIVLNMGQRDLGSLVFEVLVLHGDHILQLLMLPFVLYFVLVQSNLVLLPQVQPILNILGEAGLRLPEQVQKVVPFPAVSRKPIIHVISQCLDIGFIELGHLDLHQLDLPLVVLNQILDFLFQFIVVQPNCCQSCLFVDLELTVQVAESLDFLLLCLDDLFET